MRDFWAFFRRKVEREFVAGVMQGYAALDGHGTAEGEGELADEIVAGREREDAEEAAAKRGIGDARVERAKSIEAKAPTLNEKAVNYAMQQETHPLDPFEQRLRDTLPENQDPYVGVPPKKRGRPRKNPDA